MTNDPNVKGENISPIKYAMHCGLYLGAFWAFKYLVFMASGIWIHFIYLYYLLNVGTFLLIYIFYIKFMNADTIKVNEKFRGFIFTLSLCFFASFFEIAMIYVHFQFIDPSYYLTKIEPNLVQMVETLPYPPDIKASALSMISNKILYLFSTLLGNMFLGLFLGGLMTLLVKKTK